MLAIGLAVYLYICEQVEAGTMEQPPLDRLLVRPFDQGINAKFKGLALEDCPYEAATANGVQWAAGWLATTPIYDDSADAFGYTVDETPEKPKKFSKFQVATLLLILIVLLNVLWANYMA